MSKKDTRTPKETAAIFERMTKALVKGRPTTKIKNKNLKKIK